MVARKGGEPAAFLAGDPTETKAVREAIGSVVRGFRFHDKALEAELIQEALGRTFVGLSTGRFRGDSTLGTYVQSIAKYVCLEHLRRRRLHAALDVDSITSTAGGTGPEERLLIDEEHRARLRVFLALPRESRELFRMILVDGLSYQEIARRFGVSEGAIKSRVHRCRLSLREVGRRAARREAPGGAPLPNLRRFRGVQE